MRPRTLLPAALALLAACDAGLDTAAVPQELAGAEVLPDNVAPFASVTLLNTFPGGPNYCVATKIGPHRFLTSARCLYYYPVESTITLSNDLNGIDGTGSNAISTKVVAFYFHPTFELGTAGGGMVAQRRGYDLAIIDVLADTPAIPVLPLRTSYLAPDTEGVVVGFGCDQVTADPSGADAAEPWYAWHKQVASVTSASLEVLRDGVSWTDEQVTSSYTSYAIATGGLRPCFFGDSGGPLLVQDGNGAWQVAGITTTHEGDLTWFARVGSASRWIADPTTNAFGDVSWGWLINGKSDLCLGVAGDFNTPVQSFCDGRSLNTDGQVWRVRDFGNGYQLKNGLSGQCLSVPSLANGAPLIEVPCMEGSSNASRGQEWKLEPVAGDKLRIRNVKSGRCIGVPGASTAPGVAVAQYTCDGFANQGWIFSH